MPDPVLAPEFAVRDVALSQARDALLAFALRHNFVDGHLCACGDPGCRNAQPETMPLTGLLRAVAVEWTATPDPAGERILRNRLLLFARAFGVLECPCGDAQCPTRRAEEMDTRGLLRVIADVWHGRAGNRVHSRPGTAEEARGEGSRELDGWLEETSARYARALGALDALAARLDPRRADAFRRVASMMAASRGRAWPGEARAMAAEAAATWLPRPQERAEVHHVLDAAIALAWHAGWSTEEAALLEGAAADACLAILTAGIVHHTATAALYAPFAEAVPLDLLHDDVDVALIIEARAA